MTKLRFCLISLCCSVVCADIAMAQIQNGQVQRRRDRPFRGRCSQCENHHLQSGHRSFGHVRPAMRPVRTASPSSRRAHTRSRLKPLASRPSATSGVTLNAGTTAHVDAKMSLGQTREVVEVTGAGSQVNTEEAKLATTVSATQIENLPLNGRNVYDLMQLAPGAVNVNGVDFENGHGTVVNGLREDFNGFLINGVANKGSERRRQQHADSGHGRRSSSNCS